MRRWPLLFHLCLALLAYCAICLEEPTHESTEPILAEPTRGAAAESTSKTKEDADSSPTPIPDATKQEGVLEDSEYGEDEDDEDRDDDNPYMDSSDEDEEDDEDDENDINFILYNHAGDIDVYFVMNDGEVEKLASVKAGKNTPWKCQVGDTFEIQEVPDPDTGECDNEAKKCRNARFTVEDTQEPKVFYITTDFEAKLETDHLRARTMALWWNADEEFEQQEEAERQKMEAAEAAKDEL